MVDAEEYFPRGGKKPVTKYFNQSSNFLGTAEKTEKKKRKPKKKSEGDDGYLSDELNIEYENAVKLCAPEISYKTVKEGTLILGRVKSVHETKIFISLPGRMSGTVMACYVSSAYNKLLEEYVDDKVESVRDLCDMFKPGQYVAVKVIEVEQLQLNNNLLLSLMPQHINGTINFANLTKGILLQAAVSSVEDHGYAMDLGIPNTRAFLPKTHANEEIQLDTGSITWCTVKSVTTSPDSSIVKLSNELAKLQTSVLKRKNAKAMSHLLPGTAVEFTVDSALENGIKGNILDDRAAYIKRQHADTVKGKKPKLGQKVTARVLYEVPTSKMPFLTLRNIFETTYPDLNEEAKYKDGDIIENAQVIKVIGRSVFFKLDKKCVGVLNLKGIRVDEDLTDEQVIIKSYPLGSEHKVRVLFYSLSDYFYTLSDRPEVVNERYFSVDELKPGDIVDAVIKSVSDNMTVLQIGRFTGAVTTMHMSDAGICVDPKRVTVPKLPKKKFKVGQPVKARVLFLSENNNIFLTMKPSLLSTDLELVKDYNDCKVGRSYTGFIKHIKPDYLLVHFFNNISAYIHKKFISQQPIEDIREVFHVGQIVNCTITYAKADEKKLIGSFIKAPFDASGKTGKRDYKRKIEKDSDDLEEHTIEPRQKKKKRNDSEPTEGSDLEINRVNKKTDKPMSEESGHNNIETDLPRKKKKKNAKETVTEPDNNYVKVKKSKKEENQDVKEILKKKIKEIKVAEDLASVLDVPSAKDFWSLNESTNADDLKAESSSSDEEVTEQPKKKRKKLTAAEKVGKARAEEERLRALERRAADDSAPRSVDQFERALLANPSCSELWIAYMAFHLQATEIEKARAVGRKALKTISFREEDEKLNVWVAMLNFENRFGTKESQQQTLEEALQMNEPFKIHSKLLDIYVETSKVPELSSLVDLMIRKYKRNPDTFIAAGNACFTLGLVDKARAVMQKALSVLEKKKHVSVLVQFALSERAHGSPERAEALFEQILSVYPQRVDVCAVYVDMLYKSKDTDNIRQVMERMTSQKLPARKMKTLFKKWIEIEEKIGKPEEIKRIRQKAMEFIDKAQF